MTVLITLVFVAVFLLVVVLAFQLRSKDVAQRKQTAVRLTAISAGLLTRQPDDPIDGFIRENKLSSTPWINALLLRMDLLDGVRVLLVQSDLSWTVGRLLGYCGIAGACGFTIVYLRTGQMPASMFAAVLAAFIPVMRVYQMRARRLARFERRLPEALEMMVSSIRAGHSLLSALGTVAKETPVPISTEFRKCFDEQNFGLDMRIALRNLAARVPLHDVQIVVTAILIQHESGGNLAEILERVAHVIRQRFRLKNQIRTHTAQGRLTGWILALLPVILGSGIYLVNPEYMSRLWQNSLGAKLLYTSAGMTLVGALIIRKIINVRI